MVTAANPYRDQRTQYDPGMGMDELCDALNLGLYIGVLAPSGSAPTISSAIISFLQSGSAESDTVQAVLRRLKFVTGWIPVALHTGISAGTNTTDLTTYIQEAIDDVCVGGKGDLIFPDGTYLITSALSMPGNTGWRIRGQSTFGTTIQQDTDNTAILHFDTNNTSGWEVDHLTLTYTNVQDSSDTLAVPFYFSISGGGGVSNFHIHHMYIKRGYYPFANNSAAANHVWGGEWNHINIGDEVSGGVVFLVPSSGGMPNNSFKQFYVAADSMTTSLFRFGPCTNTHMDNIEINDHNNGDRIVYISGGGSVNIGTIRIERGTLNVNNELLFDIGTGGYLHIGHLQMKTLTLNVTNFNYIIGTTSASYARAVLDNFEISGLTVTSGTIAVSKATSGCFVDIGGVEGVDGTYALPTGVVILNSAGSTAEAFTRVRQWEVPKFGTDVGDAAKTLTYGTSEQVQLWATDLTADRAVTLATSNSAMAGAKFKIKRTGGDTGGPWALNVGTGPLIALAQDEWCVVEFDTTALAWVVTEAGSLA